jgi:two-component system, cell cycle sensor histidine kinase and response regulator CckA
MRMKPTKPGKMRDWLRRNTYLSLGATGWTVVVSVFLGVDLTLHQRAIGNLALAEARVTYESMTLIKSFLMAGQIHNIRGSGDGIRGRLTSLNPVSPSNQPDDWERKALHRLAAGVAETSEVSDIDGRSYLRLMHALIVRQECLQCHGGQGYKVGDIRGGISVAVPLAILRKAYEPEVSLLFAGYGAMWLIGLGGWALVAPVLQRRNQERRESQATFRDLFDNAPVPYHELDLDGMIRRVNRAECDMLGYQAGEMLGRPVWEFVAGAEREFSRETVGRKLSGAQAPAPIQCHYVRRDGSELLLEIYDRLVRDGRGETAGLRSTLLDITQRQQAEDALRESEIRYRSLFEQSGDYILVLGLCDGGPPLIRDANEAALRAHGYSREEMVGQPISLLEPDVTQEAVEERTRLLDEGKLMYMRHRRKDGSVFGVESMSRRVRIGARDVILTVERDITERRRAEKERERLQLQLAQAQKMESIGRMAGGVAHDFNNLLTVINGYSQFVLAQLSARDPHYANISEIYKAGERAATLTRQLLAFSRKQVLQPRRLDLNLVVQEMRPMLERLVGEDVEMHVALNAQSGSVHADPPQLEQVIMNLAANARDAMPDGGRLLIETAEVEWDESHVRSNPEASSGRYVMLAVSDSGVGMDEATRQRIFEPFFTTKEVGRGTGLGLSMVQGIVAQSGGYIDVRSEPFQGTTFKIYLPAQAHLAVEAGMPAAVPALEGKETVLVVEDQAEVRNYAVAVLKAYGYRVISAEDPGEALRLCEQEAGRIHLVLTDVVMPNSNGRELANRLKRLRPGIKVLFMSGYTGQVVEGHGVVWEGGEFIQKPFSPEELAEKVRSALGPVRE